MMSWTCPQAPSGSSAVVVTADTTVLRSSIEHLGSREFMRLRIGIGHPGHKDQVHDYVLSKPSPDDREQIHRAIEDSLDVMGHVVGGDFARAMNTLHARPT